MVSYHRALQDALTVLAAVAPHLLHLDHHEVFLRQHVAGSTAALRGRRSPRPAVIAVVVAVALAPTSKIRPLGPRPIDRPAGGAQARIFGQLRPVR